jgi:hypothetical protein
MPHRPVSLSLGQDHDEASLNNCETVFGQSHYLRDRVRPVSGSVRYSLIIFETNAVFAPCSLTIFETRQRPGIDSADCHSPSGVVECFGNQTG